MSYYMRIPSDLIRVLIHTIVSKLCFILEYLCSVGNIIIGYLISPIVKEATKLRLIQKVHLPSE